MTTPTTAVHLREVYRLKQTELSKQLEDSATSGASPELISALAEEWRHREALIADYRHAQLSLFGLVGAVAAIGISVVALSEDELYGFVLLVIAVIAALLALWWHSRAAKPWFLKDEGLLPPKRERPA